MQRYSLGSLDTIQSNAKMIKTAPGDQGPS
jgi:hypothetical protein